MGATNSLRLLCFREYLNRQENIWRLDRPYSRLIFRLLYHATGADAPPDAIPQFAIKITAVVAVLVIALLCVATPKLGTRTAVFFTTIKVSI
jgi:hypothetical protein